jgi:hypothetical protein
LCCNATADVIAEVLHDLVDRVVRRRRRARQEHADDIQHDEPDTAERGVLLPPGLVHLDSPLRPAPIIRLLSNSCRKNDTERGTSGGPGLARPGPGWFPLVVSDDPTEAESAHGASGSLGAVDLYWIPLGAGAHVVRISGKVFEAISAFVQRRTRCDLYHSALEIRVPEGRYVIEQAPVPDSHGEQRGVVAGGPVGTRWAGRFRIFRYEVRRWRDGRIPDIRQAIGGPIRVTDDPARAQRILDILPSIPAPVWGRDEFGTGEMWNSNSVVSWVLASSGTDLTEVHPPSGGRAPGWSAGLAVAARPPAPERCDRKKPGRRLVARWPTQDRRKRQ